MRYQPIVKQKILDQLFGGVSFTPPIAWHIGVSTTAYNVSLTTYVEPTDPAYARVVISNNKTNFTTALSVNNEAVVLNTVQIIYPQATTDWGQLRTLLFYDPNNVLWVAAPFTKVLEILKDDTLLIETNLIEFYQQ